MDKKLIDSLSNFSVALEKLVDELKKQKDAKKEKTSILSGLFSKQGMTSRMKKMEDGIKSIKKDTTQILKNQANLLKLDRNAERENNKNNVFGQAGDKKEMSRIKDGVGSIILIAGAVLAIGMAFKLVGKVDILSVLALSFAVTLLGITIAKIAEAGIPSFSEVERLGLSILVFTAATVMSSWMLMLIPNVSFRQLVTFGAILLTFSVLSFGISALVKGTSKIKPQQIVYLPLVLVGISLAIMASSFILQYIKPVSDEILLNVLKMGAVLGVLALVMTIPLLAIGKSGSDMVKGALLATLILPALSAAIVGSSYIAQYMNANLTDKIMLDMLKMGLVLGLLALVMTIPLLIIGKLGTSMLKGAIFSVFIFPLVAAAIALSSHLIAMGDYSVELPLSWAISFSMAMLVLAIPVAILGLAGPAAFIGALALVAIAGAIMISSHILAKINTKGLMKGSDALAYFIDVVGAATVRFAEKFLPVIIQVVGDLLNRVLPPLRDFINGILPPIQKLLTAVLREIFPYIQEIIGFAKTVVMAIKEIILNTSTVLDSIAGIIEKVGGVFKIIGDGISNILGGIKDIIVSMANSMVMVFKGVLDFVTGLSNVSAKNLLSVAGGISAITIALAGLTGASLMSSAGNLVDKGLSFISGDGGKTIFDKIAAFSKHHNAIFKTGLGVKNLAMGIEKLNNAVIEDDRIIQVLGVLDKISNANASANISSTTKQILDGTDFVEELKVLMSPNNTEMLTEMRSIKAYLAQISSNSANITQQLNDLHVDEEPTLKY